MSKNDEDDYWNSSDKKVITFFDEDEGGGAFGISCQGTSKLSQQLRESGFGDSSDLHAFSGGKFTDPVQPLHNIISESSLQIILDEGSGRIEQSPKQSPQDVINKCVLGIPAKFETCRSLQEKRELLELASKCGEGDTILAALLFVSQTLSKRHFYNMLRDNAIAFNHYSNYLAAKNEIVQLGHLFEALGHFKSVAILNYKMACLNKLQVATLNLVAKSHFNNDKDEKFINQHIKLLEFQQSHGVPAGLSVQQTLSHAAAKVPTETLRTSAHVLGMSERVFQWTCLKAKANSQLWTEIDAIFHTKSWLGGQKFKTLIPMAKVAVELHKAKAPASEVKRYVQLVDDVLQRQRLEASLNYLSLPS